jgi:hypothetical protein
MPYVWLLQSMNQRLFLFVRFNPLAVCIDECEAVYSMLAALQTAKRHRNEVLVL